jgi:Xaa-Pro aminopeptidase
MFPGPVKESKGKGLMRGNTMTGTKKSTASSRWGWAGRKDKEKELPAPGDDEDDEDDMYEPHPHHHHDQPPLQIYKGPVRRDSRSTQASRSTQKSQDSQKTVTSQQSRSTHHRSNSSRSTVPKPRPPLMPQDSTSTLVGSAYERKVNDRGSIREKPDTTERLDELRKLMGKDNLDY